MIRSGQLIFRLLALFACLVFPLGSSQGQDFKKQVIYQIVTDRFFDGDTSNNNPPQSPGLYDPTKTNWHLYWGGDLAGIQQKMSYLNNLGVTAIWISPPVDNIDTNIPDGGGHPTAPYHGYAAHDDKVIEEHFGDVSNSWAAFDALVSTAHQNGIKIIVDFAPNHTNDNSAGEYGALYDNGTFLANYTNDPNGYFHHNPNISDYNDRYQLQYYTLFNLADLNQENPTIDAYLKAAMRQFAQHGVDGFRIDAVKHVTWGWEYSMANAAFNNAPSFLFGEWIEGSTSDPLYHDSYKFANKSGISLLDFPLNAAIRDVFANNASFWEIENTLNAENSNFKRPNDLVTFVDNHDMPRLLSVNNNPNRLNEALAFLLTCRGIPTIYYGDEQYLHNDTNGGGDPYNRPMMASFDTTTTAYNMVNKLAGLRQTNDALGYGTSQQRWINSDVYIYERQFYNEVVLTAINKNEITSYNITGLFTALPAGGYSDYLSGLMGGFGITVNSGAGGNNPVAPFTLPPHAVMVWQSAMSPATPEVGSIGPAVGQPGLSVTMAGKGFGTATGSVLFGTAVAAINSWSDSSVTFTVPNVSGGIYYVQLKDSAGKTANTIQFTVLTAKLIPVTFTVYNAIPTNVGDYIFLTGNTMELGNWSATWDGAVGPMLDPNYPNWFINASMPAGATIQFKFIKIAANGTVTWEAGSNHVYTVPSSGTGYVNVTWQTPTTNAVFAFSSPAYSVNEGAGSFTITVNRTNDTAGASAVDFATGNNTFAPCNQFDGQARQNCKFIRTSGTLTFNPGETSKTFDVLVIDEAYVEGTTTFPVNLSNPTGGGLGNPSTATVTIVDDDTSTSITPAQFRFGAALNGAQETPPNNSQGKGNGLVLLSQDQTSELAGLLWSNLTSAQTVQHIHGPAPPGMAAPNIFTLNNGTPVINQMFNPTAQQVSDLKAGMHYMNTHTTNFPDGEIRGQLFWNPSMEESFFVTEHYSDFLQRLPDAGGFGYWTGQISQCITDVQCFHDHTIGVSNAFFFELEYQQTGAYVYRLFRAAYGNSQPSPNPDPSNPTEANKIPSYNAYASLRAQVVGGADLATGQQNAANVLLNQAEFLAKYPPGLGLDQFVDAVLQTIQNDIGADLTSQRKALIALGSRGAVMYRLANDDLAGGNGGINNRAFIDAEYNRAFVVTEYFGYLRRDGDIGGILFWKAQVDSAPLRDTTKQHAMVCSFITSIEYQARFGPNVPRTNAECPQ